MHERDAVPDVGEARPVAGVGEEVERRPASSRVVVDPVADEVRADEAGAAGDEEVHGDVASGSGAQPGVRPPLGSMSARRGLAWSRSDRIGSATPQSAAIVGVVPGHAQLVGRVVVAVDQVGDRHVGEGGEPVGDARRDVDAAVVVAAVASRPRSMLRVAPSVGEPCAQVVEHDPGPAEGHVPVVGLVEVVVQPDDGAGLAVAPVALDHLPAPREPLPAVGLDEEAPLVAVHRGVDDEDAVDDARTRLDAPSWASGASRGRPTSGRPPSAAWPGAAARPRDLDVAADQRVDQPVARPRCGCRRRSPSARPRSRRSRSRSATAVNGPM